MKHQSLALPIFALLVTAGCGSKEEPPTTATQEPATAAPKASNGDTAKSDSHPLGTKQELEHFAVNLMTEPAEPKAGKVNFVAEVWHHGEPFADAKVHIETDMPSMGMGGPAVDLKHTSGNSYEGSAELPMGGEYQAKVHVEGEEGHTNDFTFNFDASQ